MEMKMKMRDGHTVIYEKYDSELKKYIYSIEGQCDSTFSSTELDIPAAYNEYLRNVIVYWNIEASPTIIVTRRKVINDQFEYRLYEDGLALTSGYRILRIVCPNIYEATREIVKAHREGKSAGELPIFLRSSLYCG